MQAWQFSEIGQPLALVELPTPEPRPGEVIVQVRAAGLCHSDVGIIDGTITSVLHHRPIVLGHEIAGVVSALGAGVSDYSIGDRVAIFPAGDGHGPGLDHAGTGRDGGYAEYTTAWTDELVLIPDDVSFDQAAAATDAGMTSYRAVVDTGGVVAGSRVGIVGLGGLGLTAARIAVVLGAEVYAAEINPDIGPRAQELGVKEIVGDTALLAPFELDVIIDFAGFGTTTASAIESVRRGGRVVQVGLGQNEATISTLRVAMGEITLVGSRGGTASGIAAVLGMISSGELTIVTTPIAPSEIGAALERLARGEIAGSRLVAEAV